LRQNLLTLKHFTGPLIDISRGRKTSPPILVPKPWAGQIVDLTIPKASEGNRLAATLKSLALTEIRSGTAISIDDDDGGSISGSEDDLPSLDELLARTPAIDNRAQVSPTCTAACSTADRSNDLEDGEIIESNVSIGKSHI
jgi:hypothetical protein